MRFRHVHGRAASPRRTWEVQRHSKVPATRRKQRRRDRRSQKPRGVSQEETIATCEETSRRVLGRHAIAVVLFVRRRRPSRSRATRQMEVGKEETKSHTVGSNDETKRRSTDDGAGIQAPGRSRRWIGRPRGIQTNGGNEKSTTDRTGTTRGRWQPRPTAGRIRESALARRRDCHGSVRASWQAYSQAWRSRHVCRGDRTL